MSAATRLLVTIVLASPSSGCAIALSGMGGPSVDTTGAFGGEGQVDAVSAVGSNDVRFYGRFSGGGGYLHGLGNGYGTIAGEIGVESGDDIRVSGGPVVQPRFMPGRTPVGIGGAVNAVFRVTDRSGEDSALYLGPRLQGEYLTSSADDDRGLFTLSLLARWVVFDTSRHPFRF